MEEKIINMKNENKTYKKKVLMKAKEVLSCCQNNNELLHYR